MTFTITSEVNRLFLMVLFVIICVSVLCVRVFAREDIIPIPKYISLKDDKINVGSASPITMPGPFKQKFRTAVNSIENVIRKLPITDNNPTIIVDVMSDKLKDTLSHTVYTALKNREAFWLEITSTNVKILGADNLGALHGLTFLEKLASTGEGKIAHGRVLDWPDHKIRALHLPIWKVIPKYIKALIKKARLNYFNTLIVQLAGGVRLTSMKGLAEEDAWEINEFLEVIQFARENGFEVIPEIKLLTHQEKLLRNGKYENIMFNTLTYDPRKKETYEIVLPIVCEVIELMQPKAIHIGHDEVAIHHSKFKRSGLREDEEILPCNLFLQDVKLLYTFLNDKGIETWMWGDMLLGKEEFPEMCQKHLHGFNGYVLLRNEIPKNIIICDWHYFDQQESFPSAKDFADRGYKVLGATWKSTKTTRNFSNYVKNIGPNGGGMIATTWFHVQKKQWKIVEKIIEQSGASFWNAKNR